MELFKKLCSEIRRLKDIIYAEHGAGGNLHLVLDDDNLDDFSLGYCCHSIDDNGAEVTPETQKVERELLLLLRRLSEHGRDIALNGGVSEIESFLECGR